MYEFFIIFDVGNKFRAEFIIRIRVKIISFVPPIMDCSLILLYNIFYFKKINYDKCINNISSMCYK